MVAGLSLYEGYLESEWFAGLAYIYNSEVIQINDLYEIYTTSQYWSAFPRSPMVMDLNYYDHRIIIINNHYKCCGDGIFNSGDSGDEETRRYQANLLLKAYIDENFSDENVIYNEQEICYNSQMLRIDKLVVTPTGETLILDYKTGEEANKNVKQVENYIEALQSLGFENVKGFLYYTKNKLIQEIN